MVLFASESRVNTFRRADKGPKVHAHGAKFRRCPHFEIKPAQIDASGLFAKDPFPFIAGPSNVSTNIAQVSITYPNIMNKMLI